MREGCDPLALSHGAVLVKISVSDGAGSSVPARNLISGEAEHSLVGLIWRGFGFSTELVQAFRRRIWFPAKQAWGAPLPYISSGDGVREGCDPLALSRGCAGGNLGFHEEMVFLLKSMRAIEGETRYRE